MPCSGRRRFSNAVIAALLVLFGAGSAAAQDMGRMLLSLPKVTASRALRDISDTQPAHMLVIGDSLAQGFGQMLQTHARARGLNLQVDNAGRVSTGLSRGDFYDWPEAFARQIAIDPPEIVVAHFGANDRQSVVAPGVRANYGSALWPGAYSARMRQILDDARAAGIMVYVLGPAPVRNRSLNRHIADVNSLFKTEATAAGAVFLPLHDLGAPDGSWQRTVTVDGRPTVIRSADGSHFTVRGYGLVADMVLDDLTERAPKLVPVAVPEPIRTLALQ